MSSTTTTPPSAVPIRRRPRICKTCLPCRASKVRCDRNVPCSNCAKRGFKCTYSSAPGGAPASAPAPAPALPSPLLPPSSATKSQFYRGYVAAPTTLTPSSVPSVRIMPDKGTGCFRGDHNGDEHVGGAGVGTGYYRIASPAGEEADEEDDGYYADGQEEESSETVAITQHEWDEIHSKMDAMEHILGSLHSLFKVHSGSEPGSRRRGREPDSPLPLSQSKSDRDLPKPDKIHIGSRSALVDILDRSKKPDDTAKALPKDDLLAELALGNQSVAYPFVDLWSSDPYTFNIEAVCEVLPEDVQCHRFFSFYRDIGAVLYPVLEDIAVVEYDLHQLLRNRAQAGGQYRPDDNVVKPFGKNLGFLSLLFAVLASGSQLSDLSASERELTSWVYVSCSYQCLRMMNYVAQPTVEVIQILLIITNVLSYNMNAGASYTLLGMTERMCMVLGLHVESQGFTRSEQAVRRRVWWAMAFQNSHFSLAYDRPSITMVSHPEVPYDCRSMPGNRPYFESLCRVVALALEVLRGRLDPEHSHVRYHDIREYKQRMHRILTEAAPHLRFRDRCQTLADDIERTELRLHSCYLISVICRVSFEPNSNLDDYRRALIRENCISNLIGTIESFVELHFIHSHCSRSWISAQRTIACAFLLVAHDGQSHPRTASLIQNLQDVLTDHVYADGAAAHNSHTDSAQHLSSSLRALREISAAFRAHQMQTPDSSNNHHNNNNIPPPSPKPVGNIPHIPMLTSLPGPLGMNPPSPAAAPPTPQPATYGYVPGMEYYPDMRSILDQVSDVMLFPNSFAEF